MKSAIPRALAGPPCDRLPTFAYYALYVAAAVLLLFYQMTLGHLAQNVGYADDLVDVLWFFEIWQQSPSAFEALATLFLPNHEHITFFNHLVYLAHWWLTGTLNFFAFILYGQLALFIVAYVVWRWLQPQLSGPVACLLTIGLLFNLYFWQASFFAMTALSNQFVVAFAMLAVWCWSSNPYALWLPILWSVAAALTQFNGLLVLPVLCIAVVVRRLAGERHEPLRGSWLAVGVALIALYLCYESPLALDHLARQVQATDSYKAHEFEELNQAWSHASKNYVDSLSWWHWPLHFIGGLLVVVGATFWPQVDWALWPAALTGAAMLGLAVRYLVCDGWRDRFWLASCGFLLASLLLVVIGRALPLGLEFMLSSRYRINSFLLLLLIVGPYLARQPLRYASIIAMALSALIALLGWWTQVPLVRTELQTIQSSYRYFLLDGGLGRSQMPFYPHNQDKRLFKAHEGGYYKPYSGVELGYKPMRIAQGPAMCPSVSVLEQTVKAFSKRSRALAVELTFAFKPSTVGDEILLCNAQHSVLLALGPAQQQADGDSYLPQVVLKSELAPAHYQVYARARGSQAWRAIGTVHFP